jgi:hypothetical protein
MRISFEANQQHDTPIQHKFKLRQTRQNQRKKKEKKKKKKLRNCSAEQLCFLQQNKSCRKSKAEAHNTNHRERATKKKKKKKKKKNNKTTNYSQK